MGGVVVEDGMDDVAGGNGALDGAEEDDELGVRVLELSIYDFLHERQAKTNR
jgi:hypothetical protein